MTEEKTIGGTQKRRWLRLIWRSALVATAMVLLLGVAVRLVAPLLVSVDQAKLAIEGTLSSWTGAKVEIDGPLAFSVWPRPTLTVHAVRLTGISADPAQTQIETLASVDTLSVDLKIADLLRGRPGISDIRLTRPVVLIAQRSDGALNWQQSRWMADALASPSPAESVSQPRPAPIGEITVENGRVDIVDIDGKKRTIDAVNGTMRWPTPASKASGALSAVLEGEAFSWTFSCDTPLRLLSGQHTSLDTTLVSAPATVRFSGTLGLSPSPYAAGALAVQAASLPMLVDHVTSGSKVALPQGMTTLAADATLSGRTLKMDNLTLGVDGSTASGVLDLSWAIGNPRLGGTLAFDELDIASLTAPFLPLLPSLEHALLTGQTILGSPHVDLRVSVREARFERAVVTDIAAGLLIDNGRLSLDVGDATYADGIMSGHAEFSSEGTRLRAALQSADLTPLIKQFGITTPLPLGNGTWNAELSTPATPSAISFEGMAGTLSFQAQNGRIDRFDVSELERLLRAGASFDAIRIADDAFSFQTADLVMTLNGGRASLDHAEIVGSGHRLSLRGSFSATDATLALNAKLQSINGATPAIPFTVSGPWRAPVFTPAQANAMQD